LQALEPIQQINAGVLDIRLLRLSGDNGGSPMLLHGWPYDIHSYVDVAPMLAARGCRVIVPHLRGHGTTRFLQRYSQVGPAGLDRRDAELTPAR
jgi:pimeloyl-ACP methyl ester carboxylesterase